MRRVVLLAAVLVASFTFVADGQAARVKHGRGATPRAVKAVRAALSQRGVRYRWGGSAPARGFDCSGLVAWAYSRVGLRLPHSSYALAHLGRRVRRRLLRPGDLVFFHRAGHVGIYVGRGRFVHAPRSGGVVRMARLDGWYAATYGGARRIV
jgi:cell wall-associated NlpC family hydrolase